MQAIDIVIDLLPQFDGKTLFAEDISDMLDTGWRNPTRIDLETFCLMTNYAGFWDRKFVCNISYL